MDMEGDVMQWLVRWSAMVQTRFKEGKDGKTAWERMKGKKCDLEVVPFGEKVWYKKLKESGTRDNKMEARWEEGIWMGHMGRTTEAVIGTREGVVKAWAIKRRLDGGTLGYRDDKRGQGHASGTSSRQGKDQGAH